MARKMLVDGEIGQPNDGEEAQFEFDLFVIGAGSGGVRAARFSANYGAKVGICELPFHPISSEVIGGVGGTCVIRGCVPKKILVYGAAFGGEIEDARNYGWELNDKVDFNWKKLLQKKTDEITRLNGIYKRLLSNSGVKLFEGEGKIVGPHEVEVTQLDGTKLSYTAKHILIATGSRAQRAPIPGQELAITSDEALSLDELPKHVVVLGGGYIAVEFASIWRGMGATVDLLFRKELPLRGFDDEMRAVVARNLEGRRINLHPRTTIKELSKTEGGIKVITDHGEELVADVVLFATGRIPNSKRLNLEAVGVEVDATGAVKVNEYSQTNIPSIWAVGDVTNRMNLTPVALMEGTCFAKTVFGGEPNKPDYNYIPCAVFRTNCSSIQGGWCFDFRRNLNDRAIEEFSSLSSLLEGVSFNNSSDDSRKWVLNSSGIYSCKSFYDKLVQNDSSPRFEFTNLIWKSKAPNKVKFLVWIMVHGKLNTCDAIQRRHSSICLSLSRCIMCKKWGESLDHLFLQCPVARLLWHKLLSVAGMKWVAPTSLRSLLMEDFKALGDGKKATILWNCGVFAIFWVIWDERNKRIFEEREEEEIYLGDKMFYLASLWASSSIEFKDTSLFILMLDWKAAVC